MVVVVLFLAATACPEQPSENVISVFLFISDNVELSPQTVGGEVSEGHGDPHLRASGVRNLLLTSIAWQKPRIFLCASVATHQNSG